MSNGDRSSLLGCRFSRLTACMLSIIVLRCIGVAPAQTISEANLWQQLQSNQATVSLRGSPWVWRGDQSATLKGRVTITGPGSLILHSPNTMIMGLGENASLMLRDVTVFYKKGVLESSSAPVFPISSGPFPAFNGSSLNLAFENVTVIAPFRTLANISRFWSVNGFLETLEPQLSGGLGSGLQRVVSYSSPEAAVSFSNVLLLPSDARPSAVDCYAGGVPVTDSPSLRAAMGRNDVSSVFVYRDFVLDPKDFNYSNPVNLTGNRSLEVYGCSGTALNTNYNWTRFGMQISNGGALTLRGLTLTDVAVVNQLFWPRFLAPLIGLVYVGVGGGCTIESSTIVTIDSSNLGAHFEALSASLPATAKPVYNATTTVGNTSRAFISSWFLSGDTVWDPSPGIDRDGAAAASFWRLRDVIVASPPESACPPGIGVNADNGRSFRDLLKDDMIPAIRVVGDIQLVASEWPPEASGPAQGQIFVNGTKTVYACHPVPGKRYTIDFGNLGQVVFVFGTLSFRGSLLLTHPRPSPRRSYMYMLIGALSVEADGVIQFDGVEIRGNTSSPFTNAIDPFWNYWYTCGPYCSGFIPPRGAYLNISYFDAFIFQYRFNKTEWVAVSQNRSIQGAGFWGYTDVALTWRPDGFGAEGAVAASKEEDKKTPVAAIAAPVAVCGTLVIAATVVLVVWLRRRSSAAAAAAAAAAEEKYKAAARSGPSGKLNSRDLSYSGGGGDPLAVNYHLAGGVGGGGGGGGSQLQQQGQHGSSKESGSTPAAGSSTGNNAGPTTAVANSTTFSTSMMSASMPTEARIEDMKRAITAHNALAGTHRSEQITLTELLGEGTFGKVYRGTWRGTTVAIKTMVLPTNMSGKEKREKMAVMETAISSSLSHPNIVQTYTYAILPVKGDGNQLESKLGAGCSLEVDSTSPLGGAAPGAASQSIHSWEVRLVLEYCDRGSLRDVLNEAAVAALRARGNTASEAPEATTADKLAAPAAPAIEAAAAAADIASGVGGAAGPSSLSGAGGGGGGVAAMISRASCPLGYAEVLDNCLDVARAMLHMHSENIVHGDLKARNILLKSGCVGDGRSYVAKVADFGLSLRIDPHETHVSNVYQGTITHMAPEVLLHGKVSKMSDVYAFAILMWEAYTAGQAFKGTPRALLGHEVTKMNRRPQFPLDTPFDFQLLACRCWESDPSIRPTFDQIIGELTRMKAKLMGDPGARPAAPLGPPIGGSLATGTATAAGAAGVAGPVAAVSIGLAAAAMPATPPAGDDSLMTASTAALPMMYGRGRMQIGLGGGGGGGGGGLIQSVTMHGESSSSAFPNGALGGFGLGLGGGQGLFYLHGVDGSTTLAASHSADCMNAMPGAFTIGARPPFFAAGAEQLGGAGGGGGGFSQQVPGSGAGAAAPQQPPARPPPSMPPILESHPAQLQPQPEQEPES